MRKFAVVLCALLISRLAGAAVVTYNTGLESSYPTIRNIGVDPAGNLLVVTNSVSYSVTSISPTGAVNWVWTPPFGAYNPPVSAFGSDGSTYISAAAPPGIANSSVLLAGTVSQPYYIARIDPSGNQVWAAYLGDYVPKAIAVDLTGNVYLTGVSAVDSTLFTTKLNAAGNSILYLNRSVGGPLIAVGSTGKAVIDVTTQINGLYPLEDQVTQTIVVLDTNGNELSASYSAASRQQINALQVDSAGNIYLAGWSGPGLPLTSDAFQPEFPSLPIDMGTLAPPIGDCDPTMAEGVDDCTFAGSPSPAAGQLSGFVTILSPDASKTLYSTYFGGSGATILTGLSVDEARGHILLAGYTNASDTPGLDPANARCIPSLFSAEMSLDGSALLPTIPVGFTVPANAIRFATMAELPSGVVALSYDDPDIALVDRSQASPVACITNSSELNPTRTVAPGQLLTVFGSGLGSSAWAAAPVNGKYPTVSPDQVSATVNGIPAPLLYTSPDQINLQVPFEVAGSSTATLIINTSTLGTVSQNLRVVWPNRTLFEVPVEPGECLTSWAGEKHTLAINADGTRNSCNNPAKPGSVVRIFVNGLGLLDGPQVTGGLIPPGATTVAEFMLDTTPVNGWSVAQTTPLVGSLTGMYAVDINVGTSGYDVSAYLNNDLENFSVVNIRVAADVTELP
jgi:uncharacterized protein (TIGR03437 family)